MLDSGISPSPPPVSPASLGPVTYLAGQCQEIITELDLPLDVAMTFNCVGEVHCAMGQFTKAGTCYAFAAEQSIACGGIGEQARAVKGQAVAASAAGVGERAKDLYHQAALLFCYYLRLCSGSSLEYYFPTISTAPRPRLERGTYAQEAPGGTLLTFAASGQQA